MDDNNIKNVLDELKKENENLKQKISQIESGLNQSGQVQQSASLPDNKYFDVDSKPAVVPTVNQTHKPVDNSTINLNSKSKIVNKGPDISLIILGIIFLFI